MSEQIKRFVIAMLVMLCGAGLSNQLQAGLLDDPMSVPRRIVNVELNQLTYPVIDMSHTMPARHEVTAFPFPRHGLVMNYPVDLVRYAVSVHPAVRTVRHNLDSRSENLTLSSVIFFDQPQSSQRYECPVREYCQRINRAWLQPNNDFRLTGGGRTTKASRLSN